MVDRHGSDHTSRVRTSESLYRVPPIRDEVGRAIWKRDPRRGLLDDRLTGGIQMGLSVRRAWTISLSSLLFAVFLLVAVGGTPRAAAANSILPDPMMRDVRDNPAPTQSSMEPAMQQLLDHARQPNADWNKMTSSVQEAARFGTGTFRVAILTDDVNTLGTFLRAHGVPTPIGSVPATRAGLRVVTIDVPVRLLEKVAALDRVYTVAPAVLPTAPDRMSSGEPSLNAIGGGAPAPGLIAAGKGHHVPEAGALGYNGYGVQVSTMDSGTDFGHPDLQGTFARDTNASSPYF